MYDPTDFVSSYQFKEYWKREKDRCVHGFTLAEGKVSVSGWLYWHTVYWKIAMYVEKGEGKRKRKIKEIRTPYLRDLDWEIDHDLTACEEEGLFYALVGSRDFGKSIIAASRAGWLYTFFDNSESVISGGAEDYIKLATDKVEDGFTHLHPVWKKQRLRNDWKEEVRAGWKDKKTNQPHEGSSNSRIIVRNYHNNTMAANGTRPGFHLIDEIGTIANIISCVKDSDGCWHSGEGDKPSCLVMLAGTGGNAEVGAEAAEIFFTPAAYNLLSFDNPESGGQMGRFIPATRAKMAYKEPLSLAQYLGIDHPDLEKITILVSNEERAKKEWWDLEYKKALKSGNQKTITKFLAYWPIKPSDSFLVISGNNFPVEAAKKQKARLLAEEYQGQAVELYHDGERIRHKPSAKIPLTQFPVKDQNPDAPIVIYEHPMPTPPWGLYLGGVDPYRFDESASSESLGSIYIYKRMHDIAGEKFQDMIVASFTARPGKVEQWMEQARLLIKYYNAFTLVENDDMTFIRYMQNKGDDFYLCDQPEWLKDVVPHSQVTRGKGIHRSSEKLRNFLNACYKRYLEDPILIERDEKGSIIREVLGVSRIPDVMLLEETIKFHNKEGNFDRIIAASLVFALADKMAPIGKVVSTDQDPRFQALFNKEKKPTTPGLFGHGRPLFQKSKPLFSR